MIFFCFFSCFFTLFFYLKMNYYNRKEQELKDKMQQKNMVKVLHKVYTLNSRVYARYHSNWLFSLDWSHLSAFYHSNSSLQKFPISRSHQIGLKRLTQVKPKCHHQILFFFTIPNLIKSLPKSKIQLPKQYISIPQNSQN